MSGTGSDSGWLEAAIAWEVCASLHRQYCKGKDALFTTRQSDFVKHAENARGRAWKVLNDQKNETIRLERELAAAPPAPTEQWVSVGERLPEWVHRDDTPCFINGKEVPPTLTSKTVLVALDGGGVRTDKLTTIEGKSNGWWNTFGERVIAWQDAPAPPQGAAKGE